jgi:hypothetical protein
VVRSLALCSLFAVAAAWTPACAAAAPGSDPLANLNPQHPRLLFHEQEMAVIRKAVASDPFVSAWYKQQLAVGEKLLTTPANIYVIEGPEHTLLATARNLEGRIFTLAGLYRINGDRRFADRAIQEMLAAAAFPDWYPTHFLDDAEITAALGLGYDWLYDVLTPDQRATLRTAIATKGLDQWIQRIDSGDAIHHEHNNWNQVCNGGESVGALAIAEDEPVRARRILNHAHDAIADIMKLFAPDGGFEEGPGYWNYATSYNVLYIAALDSALGTDGGAAQAAGFDRTVDYHIQSTGPTLQFANFGDAHPDVYPSPQVFWFARRFHRPAYAEIESPIVLDTHLNPSEQKESSRFSMLGLLWAALPPVSGDSAPLPLEENFSRVAQAYMRGAWNDPQTWYVGFKGGDARASHGHLDLGSFVLDALGQRWASDLAGDSYGLPGYFGRQRWSYYRLRTEGHNTLTIDGQNQDLDANAPLIASGSAGHSLFAIADLGSAYKTRLADWKRGVALIDRNSVLVQDEFTPSAQPVNVVWNLHTFADVKIAADGRSATLARAGQTIRARILSPAAARFSTVSTQALPPQADNHGLTNLAIALDNQKSAATLAVLFSAQKAGNAPALKPLAAWK